MRGPREEKVGKAICAFVEGELEAEKAAEDGNTGGPATQSAPEE